MGLAAGNWMVECENYCIVAALVVLVVAVALRDVKEAVDVVVGMVFVDLVAHQLVTPALAEVVQSGHNEA